MIYAAIALALCLTIGGGMSVAANNAEPGDALYEYKVQVNDRVAAGFEATAEGFENVRTNITNTFDADASVETETNAEVKSQTNVNGNVEVDL